MHITDNRFKTWGIQPLWLFLAVIALYVFSAAMVQADPLKDGERHEKVIAMSDDYKKSFPDVEDISARDALLLFSEGDVIFVDVRKAKEQKVSMIPGAVTKKHFVSLFVN